MSTAVRSNSWPLLAIYSSILAIGLSGDPDNSLLMEGFLLCEDALEVTDRVKGVANRRQTVSVAER